MNIYPLKTQPTAEQRRVLLDTWKKEALYLHAEMGTGGRKVLVDTMNWLYQAGKITHAVILAPYGLVGRWQEEIERSLVAHTWVSQWQAPLTREDHLNLMIVEVERLSRVGQKATRNVEAFMQEAQGYQALLIVDEASCVRTPYSLRSYNCTMLARLAGYRRVMTGLRSPREPIHYWSPFNILSAGGRNILGYPTMSAIVRRHRREVFAGESPHPSGTEWVDMDLLCHRLEPHAAWMTDPWPGYQEIREVMPLKGQESVLREIKENAKACLNLEALAVREQRALCGYIETAGDDIEVPTARYEALVQAAWELPDGITVVGHDSRSVDRAARALASAGVRGGVCVCASDCLDDHILGPAPGWRERPVIHLDHCFDPACRARTSTTGPTVDLITTGTLEEDLWRKQSESVEASSWQCAGVFPKSWLVNALVA